jgi:hypothetical protein
VYRDNLLSGVVLGDIGSVQPLERLALLYYTLLCYFLGIVKLCKSLVGCLDSYLNVVLIVQLVSNLF